MALTTNLVAYFKMDEGSGSTITDIVNSFSLTAQNSAGFVTGKINTGIEVVAASNKYWSAGAPDTPMKFASDFTINAWVNFTNTTNSIIVYSNAFIFSSGNYHGWIFEVQAGGSGVGRLWIGEGGNNADNADVSWTAGTTGVWYMLTAVWDNSAKTMQFYANSSSIGTTSALPNSLSAAGNAAVLIGAYNDGTTHASSTGAIDEIGVWTRKLSGSEITQLYGGGNGTAYPFETIVTPAVQSATFSIPTYSPVVVVNQTIAATVQSATFSIPAFSIMADTVTQNASVSPRVQSLTFSLPTRTIMTTPWNEKFVAGSNSWSNKY